MQQKTITVVIDQDGNASVDLNGFAGQGCEKTLRDFQGPDRMIRQQRKPESYGQVRESAERSLKQGS